MPVFGASRRVVATLSATLAVLAAPADANPDSRAMEYAVKAAYLYKFAPFVQWPSFVFASPSSPFQLCVLGQDPFGSELDREVSGQTVNSHPVQIVRLQRVDAGSGCQILYLGASRGQTAAEALKAVRGEPVLTVADGGDAEGAIIHFVVKDNRVRFSIDTSAAAANRVALSSKLLSLALAVRSGA